MQQKAKDIDEYISGFDKSIQKKLNQIRAIIKKTAPDAVEKISYAIPTFDLHGNLVHFAGYRGHTGFYPGSSGIAKFSGELREYHTSRGTVQFPHDMPLPEALIIKIVKFRVEENLFKHAAKRSLRKCKNGHSYYKSSDCPTCPKCEEAKKPNSGFMQGLAAPARRALESAGITTLKKLSAKTESEILALHGVGANAIKQLTKLLKAEGLTFKE